MTIVQITPALVPALLPLNKDSAEETTPLTAETLTHLLDRSVHARAVPPADALLIAFDQDGDYDSPNFRWFQARGGRFVYVDRIIVGGHARGRGLGRALYADLAAFARAAGHDRIVCEVNTDPPNPGSHAFHEQIGFRPVGETRHGPSKAVRFYEWAITSEA